MAKPNLCSSFIIRVFKKDQQEFIKIYNLKTTECFEFANYQDLIEFLKARAYPKGLR